MTEQNGSEGTRGDIADDSATDRPLTAGLDLSRSPESAYRARRAVAEILAEWGLNDQDLVDDLLLVTSELVSNAVRHGGAAVRLDLELHPTTVRVAVSDESTALPRPREPEQEGEMGRGLFLLGALAEAWGVDNSPHGGKQVWARLRRPTFLS